ncbi:MAG: hypothetical protein LBO69_01145 [Ignavibacteria bacterium]|jgi:hypothetical protein|nr:hypothetical protein [Ignavibacteria bacterium]
MSLRILFVALAILLLSGCINPFAPERVFSDLDMQPLGDQKSIDGFFQNFLYAYNMRDTLVYSNLLAEDFIFTYRNYEQNLELSWSREEDMHTTYRLFNAAQNLNFIWNEITSQSGDELNRTIARSFNLTVTFQPTDVVYVTGKVYFILKRGSEEDNWMLAYWKDDSKY